jgi:hypothetical protein
MANSKKERSFYYYDILLYFFDTCRSKSTLFTDQENVMYDTFSFIKELQDKIARKEIDKSELMVKTEFDDRLFVIVDKLVEDEPIEFRIVLCRDDALPFIERNGILEFISTYVADNDFSLAEITHCIIFPKSGIMGAEFNFSGARPSSIAFYLSEKCKDIHHVYCKGKMDQNTLDKLLDKESLSLFSIAIKNNSQAQQKIVKKSSVFALPFSVMRDIDVIEFTLKRRKSKKKDGFESPLSKDEIKDLLVESREDFKSFKIGQGALSDSIDLLHDKLVHRTRSIQTKDKTIKPESMYFEIRKFYNDVVSKV